MSVGPSTSVTDETFGVDGNPLQGLHVRKAGQSTRSRRPIMIKTSSRS